MVLLALFACQNVELAQLETRQDEMSDRHRAVEHEVDEVREGMVELGLVARQRAGGGGSGGGARAKLNLAHQLPATSLTGTLPWRAEREGSLPELPPLPEVERTESPCGHKYKLEPLKPISDFVLNSHDLGKSSPVLLLEDGEPLRGHAFPKQFEQKCAGAFRHAGFVILFSPTGESPESLSDHSYSIGLSPDLPLLRGDDQRPVYWVYPGTTLTFELDAGWDDAWGELYVDLAGRALGDAASPLEITVSDEVFPFETGDIALTAEPDLPQGPWSIRITSPPDGPYAILDLLTVGNQETALVVTGPRAFVKEQEQ
jgi:hypothetical protein